MKLLENYISGMMLFDVQFHLLMNINIVQLMFLLLSYCIIYIHISILFKSFATVFNFVAGTFNQI